MEKEYVRTMLGRVQRSACICITGALRTTPRDALNAILHLLPADLHIKYLATCSALRLREIGYWREKPYGHSSILSSLARELLPSSTDYTIPKLVLDRKFQVKIPTRKDWRDESVLNGFDTVLFTDGSKMDCGVGAGVYSKSPNIALSYRLPDTSSVFQAEMLAIWKACMLVRNDPSPKQRVAIVTDSQAAILALKSATISSKLVAACSVELAYISSQFVVTLLWVPGHRNIEGNEMADELARRGSSSDVLFAEEVDPPINTIKRNISLHFLSLANLRWENLTTCKTAKKTWPLYTTRRTDNLLKISRKDIARIIAVFTGHWPIGEHAARLGIPFHQHCRSCMESDEKETVAHFTCKCPALARARYCCLGSPFLNNLSDLATIVPTDMVHFLNATGWL